LRWADPSPREILPCIGTFIVSELILMSTMPERIDSMHCNVIDHYWWGGGGLADVIRTLLEASSTMEDATQGRLRR
jgi:hypothetical protein